jgi:hypothetical protein
MGHNKNNLVSKMKDGLWKHLGRHYTKKNVTKMFRGHTNQGGNQDEIESDNESDYESDENEQKTEKNKTGSKTPLWLQVLGWLLVAVCVIIAVVCLVYFPFMALKPMRPQELDEFPMPIEKNIGHILGMTPVLASVSDMESIDIEKKRQRVRQASRKYLEHKKGRGRRRRGSV